MGLVGALFSRQGSFVRAGQFSLLIGMILLAQASGLLPFGSGDYPAAGTAISFGGVLLLESAKSGNRAAAVAQAVMFVIAVALIIFF